MNPLTSTPTHHAIFTSIWQDYQYPRDFMREWNPQWSCSQDIRNSETLRNLEQQEEFFELITQSDESAFGFEKTLPGLSLKKANPLGQLFYDLLTPSRSKTKQPPDSVKHDLKFSSLLDVHSNRRLTQLPDWCRYEKSEYSKLFCDMANRLNLSKANFTGNPLNTLAAGISEGELINSFVTRLRESCQHQSFNASLTARKKASAQAFKQTKGYIKGLQIHTPSLYAVPLVVCYPHANHVSVSLEDSARQLQQFLDLCHTDPLLLAPVGWWWKRECLTETGYRYALFFFFDGSTTHYNAIQILNTYGRHWHAVTRDLGAAFIPCVTTGEQPFENRIDAAQDPKKNINSVLFSINCHCRRDIFLKLKKAKTTRHFGMGNGEALIDTLLMPTNCKQPNNVTNGALSTKPLANKLYPKVTYDSVFKTKRNPSSLIQVPSDNETNAHELDRIEYFVNDALANKELPFVPYLGYNSLKRYDANELAIRYYPKLPLFIRLQSILPDRYDYSEPISCFKRCCQAMELVNLLNKLPNLKDHWTVPEYTNELFNGHSAAELFNQLVLRIRHDWRLNNCQLRVNERKKAADKRCKDYTQYGDALFENCARLLVLRIDLSYTKACVNTKTIFDMQKDLNHFLENRRNNSMFHSRKGYIAKIEFAIDKGIHCHLLLFFDGSKRKNSSTEYLVKQIGDYWNTTITQGHGTYWNINAKESHYDTLDRLGIGVINYHDTALRNNLKEYVIKYLCKTDQLIRPQFACNVRLFRRGPFPEIKEIKPGRPRKVVANEARHKHEACGI